MSPKKEYIDGHSLFHWRQCCGFSQDYLAYLVDRKSGSSIASMEKQKFVLRDKKFVRLLEKALNLKPGELSPTDDELRFLGVDPAAVTHDDGDDNEVQSEIAQIVEKTRKADLDTIANLTAENRTLNIQHSSIMHALDQYAKLDEDGRLITLRRKVGDIVYHNDDLLRDSSSLQALEIVEIRLRRQGEPLIYIGYNAVTDKSIAFNEKDFGHIVFDTMKEAIDKSTFCVPVGIRQINVQTAVKVMTENENAKLLAFTKTFTNELTFSSSYFGGSIITHDSLANTENCIIELSDLTFLSENDVYRRVKEMPLMQLDPKSERKFKELIGSAKACFMGSFDEINNLIPLLAPDNYTVIIPEKREP